MFAAAQRGLTRFLTLIVAVAVTSAQPANDPADAENGVRLAQVIVDGETLFSVRGVTARPAERRAREISERIQRLATDSRITAKSLTIEDQPSGTWILAGGQRVFALLDEDAAIEQTARTALAEVYRSRIWEAIESYRRDRTPAQLWRHGFYVLVATLLVVLAAFLGRRIVRRSRAAFEKRYAAHVEGLEHRALHIVKVEQIWRVLIGLLNFAWIVALVALVYVYLNYVLALFPWTRGFANSLFAVATQPLRTILLGMAGLIPNLVFLAILVLITRYALKIIRVMFDGIDSGTISFDGFDPEWAWPTYRLLRLLVIAFAVVVAYPYIPGSESGAFKGVSLFMGVIFSLGSSSLIGNFIAGYSLTYRRAFRVGDRVKIGENIGDVEQMRLLVTHLRTPKNEEVIVPNSTILTNEVINYSSMARKRGLILHTTVGIGYETPWRQVEAMLLEAAGRTDGVLRTPPPFVLQSLLGDFCVTYELNTYCDSPHLMLELYAELHRNILDVFNEFGVQIMTPAYERDPVQPKVVPKDQWYAAPARAPQDPQPAMHAGSSH